MANKPENLKPFVKGDPRRHTKQKGERSFKTIFEEAAREVAEALRLGEKPDAVQIELVKKGIKQGLGGNYQFYKDLMDRLYGQVKQSIDLSAEITTEVKLKDLKDYIKWRKQSKN